MGSRSDIVDGGAAISVSVQSDRLSRLARQFDRMLPDDRVYALNSVPVHLDKAGDESSAKRLIRLASDGFAQIKADRTLDARRQLQRTPRSGVAHIVKSAGDAGVTVEGVNAMIGNTILDDIYSDDTSL